MTAQDKVTMFQTFAGAWIFYLLVMISSRVTERTGPHRSIGGREVFHAVNMHKGLTVWYRHEGLHAIYMSIPIRTSLISSLHLHIILYLRGGSRRGGLGGHSRNIGLCYKEFRGTQNPLLMV